MTRLPLIILAIGLSGCVTTHDLVIRGGSVVDGTGAPARRADIAIDGDTIRRIGVMPRSMRARRIVDATGMTVTPGFIDNHAHGNPLDALPFDNFLLQGETTVVLGQDGVSPQDNEDDYGTKVSLADWRRARDHAAADDKPPVTIAAWMAAVDRKGVEVNVAALSGQGTDRILAGLGYTAVPTATQNAALAEILEADLRAGAFGMSTGLEYVPGRYSKTAELVGLANIVGNHGGVMMSHMRSEDDDQISGAIDELIAQGMHARVNISHIKIVFGQRPEQAKVVLAQLAAARARGVSISADVYPYIAGFADLSLVYPPWAKRRAEWDAAVRDRRAELETYLFQRVNKRNGPEAILIASGPYSGKTLKQVAEQLNMPFVKVLIDVFGFGGPNAAHRVMSQEVQDVFITAPDISISTDGAPWMAHPRSWGSFAKVLQDYVVDSRRMTVEQAVHKMSALPASVLGVSDRGILKPGMKADILVLDLPHMAATSTWEQPRKVPTGFRMVIVNGQVAAENGVRLPGRFGRVLRHNQGSK